MFTGNGRSHIRSCCRACCLLRSLFTMQSYTPSDDDNYDVKMMAVTTKSKTTTMTTLTTTKTTTTTMATIMMMLIVMATKTFTNAALTEENWRKNDILTVIQLLNPRTHQ